MHTNADPIKYDHVPVIAPITPTSAIASATPSCRRIFVAGQTCTARTYRETEASPHEGRQSAKVRLGVRQLGDKLIVITGAGGGIGAALAEAFAARGCKLALLDRDVEAATKVAERLRSAGVTASVHAVDVSDRASLERARDEIIAIHGSVDVLINNAGITVFSSFEQLRDDEIDRTLAINLRGVIDGCRVFLPVLRTRSQAHIVNVSSIAGLAGMPWQTIYCASKFAVRGFSAALRSELVGERIGVTCIVPGATRSNIVGAAGTRDPGFTAKLSQLLQAHAYPPKWLLLGLGLRLSPVLVRASMRALVWVARRRGIRAAPELVLVEGDGDGEPK
jgi:short-subunit dehydrogenase